MDAGGTSQCSHMKADGQRCLDMGYLFVAVGADTGMLVRGSDALAAKFK